MSRFIVYPSFLHVPRAVHRTHHLRSGYGGHPTTTSRRQQLKDDWACDGAYGKWPRHTSGRHRPLIIKAPVGVKRETVWRAVTRDARKRRVAMERAHRAVGTIATSLGEFKDTMAEAAETATRTANTLNEELLTKVSRIEFYEAIAELNTGIRWAETLAVAALIVCAALFVVLLVVAL